MVKKTCKELSTRKGAVSITKMHDRIRNESVGDWEG